MSVAEREEATAAMVREEREEKRRVAGLAMDPHSLHLTRQLADRAAEVQRSESREKSLQVSLARYETDLRLANQRLVELEKLQLAAKHSIEEERGKREDAERELKKERAVAADRFQQESEHLRKSHVVELDKERQRIESLLDEAGELTTQLTLCQTQLRQRSDENDHLKAQVSKLKEDKKHFFMMKGKLAQDSHSYRQLKVLLKYMVCGKFVRTYIQRKYLRALIDGVTKLAKFIRGGKGTATGRKNKQKTKQRRETKQAAAGKKGVGADESKKEASGRQQTGDHTDAKRAEDSKAESSEEEGEYGDDFESENEPNSPAPSSPSRRYLTSSPFRESTHSLLNRLTRGLCAVDRAARSQQKRQDKLRHTASDLRARNVKLVQCVQRQDKEAEQAARAFNSLVARYHDEIDSVDAAYLKGKERNLQKRLAHGSQHLSANDAGGGVSIGPGADRLVLSSSTRFGAARERAGGHGGGAAGGARERRGLASSRSHVLFSPPSSSVSSSSSSAGFATSASRLSSSSTSLSPKRPFSARGRSAGRPLWERGWADTSLHTSSSASSSHHRPGASSSRHMRPRSARFGKQHAREHGDEKKQEHKDDDNDNDKNNKREEAGEEEGLVAGSSSAAKGEKTVRFTRPSTAPQRHAARSLHLQQAAENERIIRARSRQQAEKYQARLSRQAREASESKRVNVRRSPYFRTAFAAGGPGASSLIVLNPGQQQSSTNVGRRTGAGGARAYGLPPRYAGERAEVGTSERNREKGSASTSTTFIRPPWNDSPTLSRAPVPPFLRAPGHRPPSPAVLGNRAHRGTGGSPQKAKKPHDERDSRQSSRVADMVSRRVRPMSAAVSRGPEKKAAGGKKVKSRPSTAKRERTVPSTRLPPNHSSEDSQSSSAGFSTPHQQPARSPSSPPSQSSSPVSVPAEI